MISPPTKAFLTSDLAGLINGQPVVGDATRQRDVIDPSSGEVVARVHDHSVEQADLAVQAARNAVDSGDWSQRSSEFRRDCLLKIADLIDEHAQTLAELEALNGGKPLAAALHGEIPAASYTFRYFADWCLNSLDSSFQPNIPGLRLAGKVVAEPVGVVAQIVPWNGPLVMAAWKLAPALAARCSVVLKPSELTPLSTSFFAQLLAAADLPAGVINVVFGDGASVGQHVTQHQLVDKVAFTGSTQTGREIGRFAGGELKRITLELGGKSPVVVFADADIERAVSGAADAIFGNAGQVCVAGSRLFVQEDVFETFSEQLLAKAQGIRVGPAFDENTTMGPLISAGHRQRVHAYVERAIHDGGTLLCGGEIPSGPGFFYPPTILSDVPPTSIAVCEEIFGPVLIMERFADEADALRKANSSVFGLAASVWTQDNKRADRLASRLRSGIVWINAHGIPDPSMPIGGVGQSGVGRELGEEGLRSYIEFKSIMSRLD